MGYEQRFSDLGVAVEEMQAYFQQKIASPYEGASAKAFCRLQLAVQEWISNLIAHASFGGRSPELCVCVRQQQTHLQCVVEDNADGFDLETELDRRRQLLEAVQAFPEEGGLGLLMMEASTERAEYVALGNGSNRLTLIVAL